MRPGGVQQRLSNSMAQQTPNKLKYLRERSGREKPFVEIKEESYGLWAIIAEMILGSQRSRSFCLLFAYFLIYLFSVLIICVGLVGLMGYLILCRAV